MPICYLDDQPHEIALVDSPMAKRWIRLFEGETLLIKKPFDPSVIDRLYQMIKTNEDLFTKMRLTFLTNISSVASLMHQETLTEIHSGMVDLQKTYRGTTDLLTRNTQGDWEQIHEHIHLLESQLRTHSLSFMRTPAISHDTTDLELDWRWENRFTAEQWAQSTSFSTDHLTIPTTELGRTPYEAFQFAPDRWREEGSLIGHLAPRLDLRATRCDHRPDRGFERWCEQQDLPVIGEHIPLARFLDSGFVEAMPTVSTMRLQA
jgi:hypothetical protein